MGAAAGPLPSRVGRGGAVYQAPGGQDRRDLKSRADCLGLVTLDTPGRGSGAD